MACGSQQVSEQQTNATTAYAQDASLKGWSQGDKAAQMWQSSVQPHQRDLATGMHGLVPKHEQQWETTNQPIVSRAACRGNPTSTRTALAACTQYPRLRRVGWGIAQVKQDAELKEACHGSILGRETVPRAELVALVVLAANVNVAGLFEVRMDAQYLLISIARPARANRGINGNLWRRFFEARDSRPPHSEGAGHRLLYAF